MQNAPNKAIRPWAEAMDSRRQELGLSLDDLAYEARKFGAPESLTGSRISQLKKGKRPYSTEILKGIAGALGLDPMTFAEYRLARARELLDERIMGIDGALDNLERLNEILTEREDLPK